MTGLIAERGGGGGGDNTYSYQCTVDTCLLCLQFMKCPVIICFDITA